MSNKQGRNNLCKCGSGRKYKFCHGKPQSISLEPKNIDQAVFISAFAESLHGRKFGQNKNNADALLIGYSVLHRRLGRCLSRALKSLSDYNERRKQEGWEASSKGSASDHLDDYLDCVYAAAELYEFYMSDVIAFLNLPTEKSITYKTKIKSLKREITTICNQCKHEHGFLQAIDVLYDHGRGVAGFCIYKRIGEHICVNRDIHKQKEAFSLNWSIRRLVGNLMETDLQAAELVKSTQDDQFSEQIQSIAYTLPYVHNLKNITDLSMDAMPKEITRPFITFSGDGIDLNLTPPPLTKNGNGKLVGFFDILGSNISCELPYVDGEMKASVNDQLGKTKPFPGFMRIVIGDISVTDD